eukprot:TRINITY_DN1571_c0_g1_i1.p1 TRINITY_DN1571_c0_g1~~TRINITY_DN1571_c0_g1_i1.p1  ORF type:complete len:342 (+),score=57.93 TRINITY_DN1571_c0_g1_i1:107-1132(+)
MFPSRFFSPTHSSLRLSRLFYCRSNSVQTSPSFLQRFQRLITFENLPTQKDPKTSEPTTIEYTQACNTKLAEHRYKGQWRHAALLFQKMSDQGIPKNTETFSHLIFLMKSRRRDVDVLQYFKQMQIDNLPIDEKIYGAIIDVFGKSRQIDKMEQTFNEMQQAGISPNIYTYTMLIDAYGKVGNLEDMEKTFQELLRNGVEPNTSTYNTMIGAYGSIGKVEEMIQKFEELKSAGLSPDLVSYSSMIGGFGKSRYIKKAFACYHSFLESGIQPTIRFTHAFVANILVPNSLIVDRRLEDFLFGRRNRVLSDQEFVKFKEWVRLSEEKMEREFEVSEMRIKSIM